MIHVDVEVPILDKTYECSLNENVKTKTVIVEIAHVIAQNEQRSWQESKERLLLCNCSNGNILPQEKTLYECNVQDGCHLMLV